MPFLNGGGFELSKWHSNHNILLEKKMISTYDVTKKVDLLTDTTIPSTEEFAFRVKSTMLKTTVITKRNILYCLIVRPNRMCWQRSCYNIYRRRKSAEMNLYLKSSVVSRIKFNGNFLLLKHLEYRHGYFWHQTSSSRSMVL